MPRAGTQVAQPAHVPESMLKPYLREFLLEDTGTWRAIFEHRPLRGPDAWRGRLDQSRYYQGVMYPSKLRFVAVAPLAGPILDGYPGAMHLYRTEDQGEFSGEELNRIGEASREIDRDLAQTRKSRLGPECAATPPWAHRPPIRQFIFDSRVRPLVESNLGVLDERVSDQMAHDAKHRLESSNGELVWSDRVALPDSNGDLWTFRAVRFLRYPALGEGSFVFYCLQPEFCDWSSLRPGDLQADADLSRLVPAMQFMREQFHRGPTLNEISREVHLSPFHFHRRFTELMGITPKHYLLECQVFASKRELVIGARDLKEIAASCGFAHQSHFTSRFKQATGLTPTRWRRMALRAQEAAKEPRG